MNPEDMDTEDFVVDLTEQEPVKAPQSSDPKRYCIPDGEYAVVVTDVNKEKSKAGNDMFVWDMEIPEGDHEGHTLRIYTALTPAALWKLSETVEALGLGEAGQSVKFSKKKAHGRRAIAKVVAQEYNDKWNSNIDKLFPHPEGPISDDIPF